jgi:hypothetical protein
MIEAQDLIIPLRTEAADENLKALLRVQRAGQVAGDATAAGAKKVTDGLAAAGMGAEQLAQSLLRLGTAAGAVGMVRQFLDALISRTKEVADFVGQMARDFIELRQAMQQVAARKGKPNTNEFAIEEIEKATAARLLPQEWKGFQEEFQSYAGAQLEGPDRKLNEKQAEEYQQRVAEFMKFEGVQPQIGVELAGTLLETSKGPQDVDQLMSRYGRVYEALKKSRTPVEQLLPQMSRVTAYGIKPEEAAELLSVIAPAMHREEQTGVENTIKALRELKLSGKLAQYSVDETASKFEQVKQLATNVHERQTRGEDIDRLLEDAKIGDMREFRGIQGFALHGVEMGGFERYERYMKDLSDEHTREAIAAYEASPAGKTAQTRAKEALAEARVGARGAEVQELKEQAKVQLTDEKRFEQTKLEDVGRGAIGAFTRTAVNDQLINERAVQLATERGGLNRPDDELTLAERSLKLETRIASGATQELANQALQKLVEFEERKARERERTNAKKELPGGIMPRGEPGKPMVAPPPGGAGQRQ